MENIVEAGKEFTVEVLGDAVEDVQMLYLAAKEAKDRATRRDIIYRLYKLPMQPSIGMIADVVKEPRAVILATIQDQGWSR